MKKLKKLFLLCVIVLVALCGFQLKSGYDKYSMALEEKPLETAVAELQSKEKYTFYDDIPSVYFDALVAVEDRRFYLHKGFDIIGTMRAVYNGIRAGEPTEGGSTITQQLAKNMYFPMDRTLTRKIAEIFMALKIEKQYTKEDILELYVNGIYYGSGYYNIRDAAMGYFNKAPSMMNLSECTLLVGIPNAPSLYSPDVNPDLAEKRQEKVLSDMVECGYITKDEMRDITEN